MRAPSAIGESGWASRGDRASQICTRATGRRVRHFGGRHRISYSRIRWSVGPPPAWAPRRGRRGPDIRSRLVRAVLVPIRARSYAVPTGLLDGWYPANPVVSIEDARAGGARWGRVAARRHWACARPRSGSAGNQGRLQRPFFYPQVPTTRFRAQLSVACGPCRAVRAPVSDARRGGPRRDEERAPLTPRGRRAGRPSVQQGSYHRHGLRRSPGHLCSWLSSCMPLGTGLPRTRRPSTAAPHPPAAPGRRAASRFDRRRCG